MEKICPKPERCPGVWNLVIVQRCEKSVMDSSSFFASVGLITRGCG